MSNLRVVDFDCGLIAPKVGFWDLPHDPSSDVMAALSEIESGDFDLVYLKSSAPTEIPGFSFMGKLLTLEGDFNAAVKRLDAITPRFSLKQIETQDWPQIEQVLHLGGRTRFWKDPNIGESKAKTHKLKMLRTYNQRFPDLSIFVSDPSNVVLGYQISTIENDSLLFYEIVTQPGIPLIALDLLKEIVKRVGSRKEKILKTRTHVYEENKNSIRLFNHLGLSETAGHFYYHRWPKLDSTS